MEVRFQNSDYPIKVKAQCGSETKRFVIRQFPNGNIRMEKEEDPKK